jgi:hypothetical protein
MRGRTFARACLPLAALACTASMSSNRGTSAYMQVRGAQFVPGPMPAGSPSGPAVLSVNLVNNDIYPSFANDPITLALGPTATAAAIGLQNDVGYWIVVAGPPSVATPDDPSVAATAAFARGIVQGTYTLVVRAMDAAGTYGPPVTQILTAFDSPTNPAPTGQLVVTLTWDTESNLNVHVVDPLGEEIFWAAPSTVPADPVDGGSYATIDYDSNANCVIDGLRREDVTWANAPPSGHYLVRVDAASLCGQPIANWTVTATLRGQVVGTASGVAVDASTRGSHGSGAGVNALEFDVP